MRRISFGNQCPLCKLGFRYSISLKFYMRFIPMSRHYLCDYCGYTSVSFFKKFSIRLIRLQVKKIRSIVDSYSANTQEAVKETEFFSKDDNVIILKN